MWRKALMTPLTSLSAVDVLLVVAMVLALSVAIEALGWLWGWLAGSAEE